MPRYTAVTIADDGATIQVLGTFNGASKEIYFNKHDSRVSGNPDLNEIYFHDASGSAIVTVAFADVVSPVLVDYDALIAFVQGLYDTGGVLPAGAATEAKQDTIIANITPTGMGDGSKDVAVAGTAEALAGATPCMNVMILAKSTNTGNVYVGGSGVSSTTGFVLAASEWREFRINDLSKVYIDVDTNGEGVTFDYQT